ncbi:ficolin-1-like [Drosophila busckii]|uniref:ficolin-1-like n=1 Tax=Drosophila busckii TaxID=30019 RepID=UPI00083F39D6|nr:ficolin-1-like [Drosophila busckii]
MKAVVLLLFLCLAVASANLERWKEYPLIANSCQDAPRDGIYNIRLSSGKLITGYCDVSLNGSPWLVIQRRVSVDVNFYRNWSAYQRGFGDLEGSFFIGLNNLNEITSERLQELYVYLEDFDGEKRFARYDEFAIGNEANLYGLNKLGKYSGNAGDSLAWHRDMKFTTYDRDNDRDARNCAVEFTGAWWHNTCHESNLNGLYLGGEFSKDQFGRGNSWRAWRGHNYSYKTVQMMIRPVA